MTAVAHQPSRHPFVDAITAGRAVSLPSGAVWAVERLVAAGVSVVHLHFGFERSNAARVERWSTELRTAGIGLVHTVHDLDNPHVSEQGEFRRTLDAAVRASDVVTTLTKTAARTIRERYGTPAAVVAHPHVVPLSEARRWRAARPRRTGIYVHAATGRPNLDLDAVERLVARPGHRPVRVHVRPQAPSAVRDRLERLARRGRIHLDERPRLDDHELWSRLAAAELVVLPYRWGTHSGLLEAAHDLDTPVLAPGFGGYGDQGAATYDDDPGPCVDEAAARRPPVTIASRRRQQAPAHRAYRAAYESAVRAAAS